MLRCTQGSSTHFWRSSQNYVNQKAELGHLTYARIFLFRRMELQRQCQDTGEQHHARQVSPKVLHTIKVNHWQLPERALCNLLFLNWIIQIKFKVLNPTPRAMTQPKVWRRLLAWVIQLWTEQIHVVGDSQDKVIHNKFKISKQLLRYRCHYNMSIRMSIVHISINIHQNLDSKLRNQGIQLIQVRLNLLESFQLHA